MLNIILFSKNRACQLELLLRSMIINFKNWKNQNIKILYYPTDDKFNKGYELLKKIYPQFNYILQERKFSDHLKEMFDISEKYTMFGMDDNVFKEPYDPDSNQFGLFVVNSDIAALSLRLHPKLKYCYPAQVNMRQPNFEEYNKFKWTGETGDYGYPMSLDFNIFRTNDLFYYIFSPMYNDPNSLESIMAMRPLEKPYMICFDKSPVMNIPLNKVQDFNNNVHGNVSANYLNEQFLSGKFISIKNIQGINNTSCHQEIDIKFE